MSVPRTAEVIVIGGGVVGCSIAYHLAKRGQRHGVRRVDLVRDQERLRERQADVVLVEIRGLAKPGLRAVELVE